MTTRVKPSSSSSALSPAERDGVTMELAACTETLLNEIVQGATRKAVAQTYRLAMQSSQPTDWARVNAAIIERWSVSGLTWIKKQAWSGKCFAENSK